MPNNNQGFFFLKKFYVIMQTNHYKQNTEA